MTKYNRKPMPICPETSRACFALNGQGRCKALEDADFGGKPCPFFKTPEQADADYETAYNRLVKKERVDLIQKYHVSAPETARGKRGGSHAEC